MSCDARFCFGGSKSAINGWSLPLAPPFLVCVPRVMFLKLAPNTMKLHGAISPQGKYLPNNACDWPKAARALMSKVIRCASPERFLRQYSSSRMRTKRAFRIAAHVNAAWITGTSKPPSSTAKSSVHRLGKLVRNLLNFILTKDKRWR